MIINKFNASTELTIEEQSEIIETVSLWEKVSTIKEAIAYCMEDEEALEAISHIADFGM